MQNSFLKNPHFHCRGGAVRHYALAHGGLNKCLAAISEESGVHDGVIALTLQGILKDETRLPTIVKCELCEKKFNQIRQTTNFEYFCDLTLSGKRVIPYLFLIPFQPSSKDILRYCKKSRSSSISWDKSRSESGQVDSGITDYWAAFGPSKHVYGRQNWQQLI